MEILESKKQGPLFENGDIKLGAIIISINTQAASWENLTSALTNSFPGDNISLEILQDNKILRKSLIARFYMLLIKNNTFFHSIMCIKKLFKSFAL